MPTAPAAIAANGSSITPAAPGANAAAGGSVTPAAPGANAAAGGSVSAGDLIISGVSTSGVNGTLYLAGTVNGRAAYSRNGSLVSGPANVILNYNGVGTWYMVMGSTYSGSKISAATTPVGLTAWTLDLGTGSPVITAFAPAPIADDGAIAAPSAPAAIAP